MHSIKSRFVTACQQLLALAVVVAVLVPATGVISLDVVSPGPGASAQAGLAAQFAAYAAEAEQASLLPAEEVEAVVEEHALTPADPAAAAELAERGTTPEVASQASEAGSGTVTVTSDPQDVTGYGAVGVTWDGGERLAEEEITLRARTRSDGEWSEWTELVYHDEHAPDPGSPEAAVARPGTDELLVGQVDQVQVQATTGPGTAPPADMKLAVVAPGEPGSEHRERAAIDTAQSGAAPAASPETSPETSPATSPETSPEVPSAGDDQIALQAASTTPRPTIYSRAQWGADEKLRDKRSLRYGTISAGFVHHTVNANNYTRAEVPGIIRSIYAYHTKSRGWSDLGYNFLVDRFGRIWEGRAGGVDRAVVGAHTLGYNDYAFAMSAIGNFETAKPTSAMIQAYGALFAWKLGLHGVSAASTSQRVGKKNFQAINGHRDAGSTACPGRYLYAQLPQIRKLAAAGQRWSTANPTTSIADTAHLDLVLRRASDKRLFVLPTRGQTAFSRVNSTTGWKKYRQVVATPDVTGDGRADILVTNARGVAAVRPGKGNGKFGNAIRGTRIFRGMARITAVGDLNRDGRNDLVATHPKTTRLYVYLGRGNGTFTRRTLARGWSTYNRLVGVGDFNGDRFADLVTRDSAGNLRLHRGRAGARFRAGVRIGTGWGGMDTIAGLGDYNGDGRPDVIARRKDGQAYVYPGNGRGAFEPAIGPIGGLAGVSGLSGAGQVIGTAHPDLVGRKGNRLVVVRHAGTTELGPAIDTGRTAPTARQVLNVGDWDRDGDADVVVITNAGVVELMLGDGTGRLAAGQQIGSGWSAVNLIAAVGDVNGDGFPDLMGQPQGGVMTVYPGLGTAGFGTPYAASAAISGRRHVGVGQWDGDSIPDSLVRTGNRVRLYPGNGAGGLAGARALAGDLSRYDWVLGAPDGTRGLIVREPSTGRLYRLPGSTTGLGAPRYLGGGMAGYDRAG